MGDTDPLDSIVGGLSGLSDKMDEMLLQIKLTNRLLALLLASEEDTVSEKSLLLLDAGFRPTDVAEMLGIHIGTVTKARSRAKGRTKH